MKSNYTYRMYGRSKGRGKNKEITKKLRSLKYSIPANDIHRLKKIKE